MHDGAAGLGDRRVEQVGADRRRRVDAEQQHQQRRHQRAAADAGEPDDGADDKTRQGVHPVHGAPQQKRARMVAARDLIEKEYSVRFL
jgi:hypothetical protein